MRYRMGNTQELFILSSSEHGSGKRCSVLFAWCTFHAAGLWDADDDRARLKSVAYRNPRVYEHDLVFTRTWSTIWDHFRYFYLTFPNTDHFEIDICNWVNFVEPSVSFSKEPKPIETSNSKGSPFYPILFAQAKLILCPFIMGYE